MNYFKFYVTNNDCIIKEETGCQSDISEVLDDYQTPAHTRDNRIRPSFMAYKMR